MQRRERRLSGTGLFRLGKQLFDFLPHNFLAFDLFPVQLTVPAVADVALFVDQIDARPELVPPFGPGLACRIDCHGVFHFIVLDLLANRRDVPLTICFRRVDADDRDVFVREFLMPARVPRVIADAVNSAERPEMHDDNIAFEILPGQGFAVDPLLDPFQFGYTDLHGYGLLRSSRRGGRRRHT